MFIEQTERKEITAVFLLLLVIAIFLGFGMYRIVSDIDDSEWTPPKITAAPSQKPAVKPAPNRYIKPSVKTYSFFSPLKPGTGWISSNYGMRTLFGKRRMHKGIDIAVPTGSPVFSAGTGVVTKAGRNGGYGLMVEVTHSNGTITRYAHLSRMMCRKGDNVGPGEMLAESGNTGRSTGPHLHFEILINGKTVNPKKYIKI